MIINFDTYVGITKSCLHLFHLNKETKDQQVLWSPLKDELLFTMCNCRNKNISYVNQSSLTFDAPAPLFVSLYSFIHSFSPRSSRWTVNKLGKSLRNTVNSCDRISCSQDNGWINISTQRLLYIRHPKKHCCFFKWLNQQETTLKSFKYHDSSKSGDSAIEVHSVREGVQSNSWKFIKRLFSPFTLKPQGYCVFTLHIYVFNVMCLSHIIQF